MKTISEVSAAIAFKVNDFHHDEHIKSCILDYVGQEKQLENLKALFDDLHDKLRINQRFGKRISFGTAGLRGPMGYGFNAMNSVTVRHATQGLCQYYENKLGLETMRKSWVCLGYDGRYNSKYFAELAAAVFMSKGVHVSLASVVTATPLTPFAVKMYNGLCGIQVTASHNPKVDNGYKVYASNGAQIIPPMDGEVHQLILDNAFAWPGVDELMVHERKSLNTAHPLMDHVHDMMWELIPAYKMAIVRDLRLMSLEGSPLKFVYTAMHGVGYPIVSEMMRAAKFPKENFVVVAEQRDPDPEFTTVVFPNPEEKGAMDVAIRVANEKNIPMIISNDPDADRFACCERQVSDGSFRQFTGDEQGAILGAIAFENAKAAGIEPKNMAFTCSAVSSRFISRMCSLEGANYFDTLTGFKWMMNKGFEVHESLGLTHVYAYEEALGYATSMSVPDKDGVSALAAWVQKASEMYAQGLTMQDYLDELCRKYGFFATKNSYYVCQEPKIMKEIFDEFRCSGLNSSYPDSIGEFPISRIRDVAKDYDSNSQTKKCTEFPRTQDDMITIYFANGAHITLRGSGTEPKLKYYSEMSHASSKLEAATALDKVVETVQSKMISSRALQHA